MPVKKFPKSKAVLEKSLAGQLVSPIPTNRPWQPAFLEALAATGSVTKSAKAAGVSIQSAYQLRRSHEDFAVAWDEAYALSALVIRDKAHEYVTKDRVKHQFYKGKLVTVWVNRETGDVVSEATAKVNPDLHCQVPYTEDATDAAALLKMLEKRLPHEFGPAVQRHQHLVNGECKVYVVDQQGDPTPEDLV